MRNNRTLNDKKRIAVCLLCILLLAVTTTGLLGGCGKTGDENSRKAKGRYVEQDIDLTLQQGEEVLNLTKSKDGNPVLFTQLNSTQVFRYEYIKGEWKQTSLDWITNLYQGKEIYFQEVQETAEGVQFVRSINMEMLTLLAMSTDGQSGVELSVPWLMEQGEYGYPAVSCLQIDSSGNIWMNDLYESKFVVISPESFDVIKEINSAQGFSNEQKMLFATEDQAVAANTEEGVYTIFDSDLNEKGQLLVKTKDKFDMCSKGDEWYQVSEEGIMRFALGNDISERLMDGSMGAMGSSSNIVAGVIAGEKEDFYVLYRQEKTGSCSLKRYIYDAEIEASPQNTLKVFGLSENVTIQDAIVGFQQAHPDIRVEYQSSGGEEGVSIDDIRTLNTELLGGNGADVLLLDGLPAEAYMEKGILADLTKLKEELTGKESYLEEMLAKTTEQDGKIYGMPVKFSIPIMYGNKETMEALSDLETLRSYMSKHPDASIFGLADQTYIRDFLFQLYEDELFTANGAVDKEKMKILLELEQVLSVNAKAQIFDDVNEMEMRIGNTAKLFHQGMFTNAGSVAILNYEEGTATDRIGSITDMMIPYTVMRQKSLTPNTIQDFYCPQGIVGINENSKQKELAEKFVRYLFSKEVQGAQIDNGLPVLVSELEKKKSEIDSEYAQEIGAYSSWTFEGEEPIEVSAGYPTMDEIEKLIELCKTLKNPAVQDCVLWNIYQTEADQCLEGSIDAETAAKNIAQKVDTYLAE